MKSEMKNIPKVDKFAVNLLALTVSTLLMPSMSSQASDLEIYKAAEDGGGQVLMMLDNSNSMLEYDDTCPSGDRNTKTSTIDILDDDGDVGSSLSYDITGCNIGTASEALDRISVLKKALLPIIADPSSNLGPEYLEKYKLGVGSFFIQTEASEQGGKIDLPIVPMDYDNRVLLAGEVADLVPSTGTPTAHAYAEAGAYMLGTSTAAGTNTKTVKHRKIVGRLIFSSDSRYYLQECKGNATTTNDITIDGDPQKLYYCNSGFLNKDYSGTSTSANPSTLLAAYKAGTLSNYDININLLPGVDGGAVIQNKLYFYGVADLVNTTTRDVDKYSGIAQSKSIASSTNDDGDTYISPSSGGSAECKGTGIYFLTDGAPNAGFNSSSRELMNTSLSKSDGLTVPENCPFIPGIPGESNGIKLSGVAYQSNTWNPSTYQGHSNWKCMAHYAKTLRSKNNGTGESIRTATVGFGKAFSSADDASNKTDRYPLDADGNPITKKGKVNVTDCKNITNADARNLCYLGEKGHGYGEGGFTYAKNSSDIASSLVNFITGMGEETIPNISTGVMALPFDQLNSQKSRGVAYLPAITPNPGNVDVWEGNLKKYHVMRGILAGANSDNSSVSLVKPVFKNSFGVLSTDTYDIWNTLTTSDGGITQTGGTFQQILDNAEGTEVRGKRNVFVDTTWMDGTVKKAKLQSVKVTGSSSAYTTTGFDALLADNDAKKQLLGFLGFNNFGSGTPPDTTTVLDTTTLPASTTFDVTNKKLGGVLHSVPQLVTTEIELDTETGAFKNDTRKDYVIYGSMDGALHFIDDSNGKEEFTFVPNQLLELQSKALNGKSTDAVHHDKYPYGVDAPWLVNGFYDLVNTPATTKYEAKQIFAMGGLRMGGSSYYALDMTTLKEPSLIYSLGSNYSNELQAKETIVSTDLTGTVNGNDASSSADVLARMGQTWAKPSIGYIRDGDERVMVNFLAGGYDMKYENNTYKPTDDNPAQGNAVYMVKVGNMTETAVTEGVGADKVEFGSDSGEVLWWASSSADASSPTLKSTKHDDMYSSVVTEVRTLDSNSDGYTDHIYYADLGGRVWRADISNNATNDFEVDRVVNVLDVSSRKLDNADDPTKYDIAPPRFYERPVITFERIKYNSMSKGKIAALITVGSGNRSKPVSDKRSSALSDAIFTFIDKDITKDKLFCYELADPSACDVEDITDALDTKELTIDDDLVIVKHTSDDKNIKTNMVNGDKQGWYLPLNYWNAYASGSYTLREEQAGIKMLNQPDAIGGILYVSRYNPDYTTAGSCNAGLVGTTQVERICLPYANCANNSTVAEADRNWDAYVVKEIGMGIVDNILTDTNANNTADNSATLGILSTTCKDADCTQNAVLCPEGEKPETITLDDGSTTVSCVTIDSSEFAEVNNDKIINPLEWMEF